MSGILPDSGFHFPDGEPGRCLFRLPSNFFQESWNNQQDHRTPNTANKGADFFFFSLSQLCGKLTLRR